MVKVSDLSSAWDEEEGRNTTLQDINISIDRGALIAVVGRVGTGKSSLLNALLGRFREILNTRFSVIRVFEDWIVID